MSQSPRSEYEVRGHQDWAQELEELLADLKRPNPYALLSLSLTAPHPAIHRAFQKAIAAGGREAGPLNQARIALTDLVTRREWDARTLHAEQWLLELDGLRNHFALLDYAIGNDGNGG